MNVEELSVEVVEVLASPYSHAPPCRVRRLNVATSSGRNRQLRELSVECARFDVTRHSGGALRGGAPIR
jgi:hypothetical protein